MLCLIQSVDPTKAFQKDDIPPNILKANEDIYSIVLTSDINRCIVKGTFPNNFKNVDITPIFKNDDCLLKVTTDPSASYRHLI